MHAARNGGTPAAANSSAATVAAAIERYPYISSQINNTA